MIKLIEVVIRLSRRSGKEKVNKFLRDNKVKLGKKLYNFLKKRYG